MEQRKEEVTRRPLYSMKLSSTVPNCFANCRPVYDLPADILSTLARKEGDGPEGAGATDTTGETRPESRTESSDGSKTCSLCGVTYHTVEDQRSHVRSDLHGYNLKQKIRGAKPVSEVEFEKLVGGMARYGLLEIHLC